MHLSYPQPTPSRRCIPRQSPSIMLAELHLLDRTPSYYSCQKHRPCTGYDQADRKDFYGYAGEDEGFCSFWSTGEYVEQKGGFASGEGGGAVGVAD